MNTNYTKEEKMKDSTKIPLFSSNLWWIGFLFTFGFVPIPPELIHFEWYKVVLYFILEYIMWPIILGAHIHTLLGG